MPDAEEPQEQEQRVAAAAPDIKVPQRLNTPFKQNRMLAWQPTYGSGGVVMCLVLVATAFIPTGAMMLVATNSITRVDVRYDTNANLAGCPWLKADIHDRCLNCPRNAADHACRKQDKCGMIANLPDHCPRNFSAPLTREQIQNIDERCDPHCTAAEYFTITETLEPPVYFYYKLGRFYQNHRSYVEGRSQAQLAGWSGGLTIDCPPIRKVGDKANDNWCKQITSERTSGAGERSCGEIPLKYATDPEVEQLDDLTYAPCGIAAWSMFNDSLVLSRLQEDGTKELICDGGAFERTPGSAGTASDNRCHKSGVSWDVDRDARYREASTKNMRHYAWGGLNRLTPDSDFFNQVSVDSAYNFTLPFLYHGWYLFEPYHALPNQVDEDFMVWMRVSMLSTFHKLYRVIDVPLEPGTYVMDIKHRFDVTPFGGQKSFVLSNAKWTGNTAYFLSVLYMTLGCLCFCLAVILAVANIRSYKDRAETLEKWKRLARERALSSNGNAPQTYGSLVGLSGGQMSLRRMTGTSPGNTVL